MDDIAGRALRVAVLEARTTGAKTARFLEEFADALDAEGIAVPQPPVRSCSTGCSRRANSR